MNEFWAQYGALLVQGTKDTLYMVFLSTFFGYVLGLPMGVLLYSTGKGGILENKPFNTVFSGFVNILRSFPFIILIVMLIPATRLIVGQAIGRTAAVFPLTIGCCPFVARLVQSSLQEIDKGVIEACQCMGAKKATIIKVILSESFPSLIRGVAMTAITLVGYSAIAGSVGAGGLGDIAIRYGYYRRTPSVMYRSVVIILVIVCAIQRIFDGIAKNSDRRNVL